MFDIKQSMFDIKQSILDIKQSTFDFKQSMFGIKQSMFDIKQSMPDIKQSMLDFIIVYLVLPLSLCQGWFLSAKYLLHCLNMQNKDISQIIGNKLKAMNKGYPVKLVKK